MNLKVFFNRLFNPELARMADAWKERELSDRIFYHEQFLRAKNWMPKEVERICEEKNLPRDFKEASVSAIRDTLSRPMAAKHLLGCGNAYIDVLKNKSVVP
jgi:hypothetical protein